MIIIDGDEYHRIGRTLYRRLRDSKIFRLSAKGITRDLTFLKDARLTEIKEISIASGLDVYGNEILHVSVEVPPEWSFVHHYVDKSCPFCGREM